MTSTDGIVIDERLVVKADASGPRSARMVLQNPRVDFAVMEVARGGILREGLGYDRNDVAVVTNVAPDHLGHARHRHPRAARRRQGRGRRGGAARRLRRAQRRRRPRAPDAAALLGVGRLVQPRGAGQPGARLHRQPLPQRWPRGRARPHRARRHDRHPARASLDAARLDPPAALDLRRHRAVQRRQRDGGGRCGVRQWGRPARDPPGPAHVHDVVLPLPRPDEPDQRAQRRRHRRLLPQRARDARAGRVPRALRGDEGRSDRPREDLADRHDRDRRRPARERHARAGFGRRRALRRGRGARGPAAARP